MPATFASITDRPRLFDDRPSPRARRARRQPAAPPRDPAPPAPELIPRDATPPAPQPVSPEPAPPAPDLAPRDVTPPAAQPVSREPASPAPDLAPRDAMPPAPDLAPRDATPPAPDPFVADTAQRGWDDAAPARHEHDRAPHRTGHSGGSLDDLIRGVWDELSSHRTVSCPVCHGQMAPRYGSAEQPVGGRCRRCGSSLG